MTYPDFAMIGTDKSGTTSLPHPYLGKGNSACST
jgi:hypothetical protein